MKKIATVFSILIISGFVTPSFAQHHDPAPPATLGKRIAIMDFKFPENLQTNQDFTLTMILYDKTNNKNFEQVSIQLAIFKEGVKNPLFNELFYDKNGEIVIDFKHKSFDKTRAIIQSPQEPFLGGYMKDYGSNIKISQNIFSEDGVYSLKATVVSIDSSKKFLDKQVTFTKEIHIGLHEQTTTKSENAASVISKTPSDKSKPSKTISDKSKPSKTISDKSKPSK